MSTTSLVSALSTLLEHRYHAPALYASIVKDVESRTQLMSAREAAVVLRSLHAFRHFPPPLVAKLLEVLKEPSKTTDLLNGPFLVEVRARVHASLTHTVRRPPALAVSPRVPLSRWAGRPRVRSVVVHLHVRLSLLLGTRPYALAFVAPSLFSSLL